MTNERAIREGNSSPNGHTDIAIIDVMISGALIALMFFQLRRVIGKRCPVRGRIRHCRPCAICASGAGP